MQCQFYNVRAEHSSEQDDQQLYEDDQQLNDEADHAHGVETVEAENTGQLIVMYKCTL